MQAQAYVDTPCVPVALYDQPVAYRGDLAGMPKGLIQLTAVKQAQRPA